MAFLKSNISKISLHNVWRYRNLIITIIISHCLRDNVTILGKEGTCINYYRALY